MTQLEIACFNEDSALLAAHQNIDRIELCEDYSQGGLTPKTETLQKIKAQSQTPVFVMIRPRGGDFSYTDSEFQQMKNEVSLFLKAGADGFVFGILTENQKIDIEKNKELVELANGLPCTFHRAFDRVEDWKEALEDVIACGFSTILTSGGEKSAMEGIETLKALKNQAQNRLTILVGGGVRSSNAKELSQHFDYLHSACILENSQQIDFPELLKIKNEIK